MNGGRRLLTPILCSIFISTSGCARYALSAALLAAVILFNLHLSLSGMQMFSFVTFAPAFVLAIIPDLIKSSPACINSFA